VSGADHPLNALVALLPSAVCIPCRIFETTASRVCVYEKVVGYSVDWKVVIAVPKLAPSRDICALVVDSVVCSMNTPRHLDCTALANVGSSSTPSLLWSSISATIWQLCTTHSYG